MNEKLKVSEPQEKTIVLKLAVEVAQKRDIKTGKIVDDIRPDGEKNYYRNDQIGLQQILNKYDTRKHEVRDWSVWSEIKDKLYRSYLKEASAITLTFEESMVLKRFLEDFTSKEGKDMALTEHEVRTMKGVLEQLA